METCDSLLLYFLYMTFGLTFLPLPTPPIVVGMGKYYDPWFVALIGGIASCIAALIDYLAVSLIMRYKNIQKMQQKKWYLTYRDFFQKVAFVTLVITAFTPLPFDPAKFLAITSKYDKCKYTIAIFVGRTPRYFILAELGSTFEIPISILVLAFVLLAVPCIWKNYTFIEENARIICERCSARFRKISKQN